MHNKHREKYLHVFRWFASVKQGLGPPPKESNTLGEEVYEPGEEYERETQPHHEPTHPLPADPPPHAPTDPLPVVPQAWHLWGHPRAPQTTRVMLRPRPGRVILQCWPTMRPPPMVVPPWPRAPAHG